MVDIVNTFGISTPRASAAFVSGASQADMPIGPAIARWNIATGERLKHVQLHHDEVTVMALSPTGHIVFTAAHCGEIATWTTEYEPIAKAVGPEECFWQYAAWDAPGTSVAITSQGRFASLAVYSIAADGQISLEFIMPGDYECVQWLPSGNLVATTCKEGDVPAIHLIEPQHGRIIHKLSVEGLKSTDHTSMLSPASPATGFIAAGFSNGAVLFLKEAAPMELTVSAVFKHDVRLVVVSSPSPLIMP